MKKFIMSKLMCSNEYLERPDLIAFEVTKELIQLVERARLFLEGEGFEKATKDVGSIQVVWLDIHKMEEQEDVEISGPQATVGDALTSLNKGYNVSMGLEDDKILIPSVHEDFRGESVVVSKHGTIRFTCYNKYSEEDIYSTEVYLAELQDALNG